MKDCRVALGILTCVRAAQLQTEAAFLRQMPSAQPVRAAAADNGMHNSTSVGMRRVDAAVKTADADAAAAGQTVRVEREIIARLAKDAHAARDSAVDTASASTEEESAAAVSVSSRAGNVNRTAAVASEGSIAWWKHADAWSHWELADADAMFGYTDCSSQSPPLHDPQQNSAWWQARSGHHKYGNGCQNCEGVVNVPKVDKLGFCPVPKNGCTYWKALFMRMDNNPLWNSTEIMDVHYRNRNKLEYDNLLLTKPGGLIVMTVRNPVTRLLSSWLDKRQDPLYLSWFADHPGTTIDFATFVETVASDVASHTADAHWAQQSDLCRLNHGASYDMYLKVECRTLWAPSLFEHFRMKQWTDAGWGPGGRDPFVRDDRQAMLNAQNGSMGLPPSTNNKAAIERGHNTGASALDEVCKYYDAELFWAVALMYVADIRRFGYAEDCQRIASYCHF